MTEASSPSAKRTDEGITLTRLFDAPRDLVFAAWKDPELMMRWWGPRDFTTPVCEIDFRVGGTWFSCMRSPEGQDYCSVCIYREIVEPERIVYMDSFADTEGNVVSASYYGLSPEWPLESKVTVTFDQVDGKTRLTVNNVGVPQNQDADDAMAGWNESMDRLEQVLRQRVMQR
ncbi:MAG TPA: SRPBCC domain-containing protein [Chloroflexi bacterium]|jgi:uncharacterized protein YndB with AHSA1/START domain|nr:SRPBCC domain-containing protein [Chloroflexota bacterium]